MPRFIEQIWVRYHYVERMRFRQCLRVVFRDFDRAYGLRAGAGDEEETLWDLRRRHGQFETRELPFGASILPYLRGLLVIMANDPAP